MSRNNRKNRSVQPNQQGQQTMTDETVEQGATSQGADQETQLDTSAPAVVDQGVQDNTSEPVTETQESPVEGEKTEEAHWNEEIDTATAAVTEQAAAAVAIVTPPVIESTETQDPTEFETFVSQIKELKSNHVKQLVATIEQYMIDMKPGRVIDFNAGARSQYQFWKSIEQIVEQSPEDEFRRLWSILLAYFNEYKSGVFNTRYVFRFSEYWHQGEEQLQSFQCMLNLIILTCDPATRADGLKRVDLNRTLAKTFTEMGRQRIVGFYR